MEKFFDNVPQDKLMTLVGKIIKNSDTESLIARYLKAGVMVNGKYENTDEGTPQGGNLSPILSMDERIKRVNWVIRGWINYFRIGKMKQNMMRIDGRLRT